MTKIKLYTFQPVGESQYSPQRMFLSSGEAFWGCISFGLSVITVLFGALVMAAGVCVMYVGLTTDSPGMMVASATVLVAIPFVWKKTRS